MGARSRWFSLFVLLHGCRAPLVEPPDPTVVQPTTSAQTPPPEELEPLRVAAGVSHACARKADGTVACWGDNRQGQLGDGTFVSRAKPVAVEGLDGVKSIGAGSNHSCAVRSSGAVACWGDNRLGQVGPGARLPRTEATDVPGIDNAIAVFGTRRRSCAVLEDRTMSCWGLEAAEPASVEELEGVVSACGDGDLFLDWVCALEDDGDVACATGRLQGMHPQMSGATQLTCDGSGQACALSSEGAMLCFKPGSTEPEPVLDGVSRIVGGCGLTDSGWHCLMQGARGPATPFALPPGSTDPLLVGPRSYCAATPAGTLTCFGDERPGLRSKDVPWVLARTDTGLDSSSALTEYGADVCGRNAAGTETCFAGEGEPRTSSGPSPASTLRCLLDARGRPKCDDAPVKGARRLREIIEPNLSFSSGKACGLTLGGEVECWTLDQDDPGVWRVPGIKDAETLAVSRRRGCVRHGDGRVECWDDRSLTRSTPVSNAAALVSAGGRYCVLLESGQVSCWGDMVAFESLCDRSGPRSGSTESPAKIAGIDDAIALAAGPFEACALERDGLVSCWDGFLGWPSCAVDEAVQAREVAKVSGATDIAVGHGMVCALTEDGSVRCFVGSQGAGMAHTVVVAAPQRVAALDGAVELVLGRMACARFEDGSVRCSDEHDALLDTRFIEVEALRGHQLRDGGSTLVGFKDNGVLFLGSYGQRSAELPSPIEDLVSREGVTCVLLGGGEVWCTPPGVEFTFERDQPPQTPARMGSDGDAVCAVSAGGSASCRTFGTRWDTHPSTGKLSRIEGDLGGTCRVVGSDTICDTTPLGWSTKVGAMPANAITRLSGIEIKGAAFGAEHRCVLQPDRRVACWGSAEHGQLGTGDLDMRDDPTPIAGLTGVKTIDVRGDASCALTEGGQVWCWGAVGGTSALELNELDATWAQALR